MDYIKNKSLLVTGLILVSGLTFGCTTTPPANINIGGADSCPPSDLTLNIYTDIDKITRGDESPINDDDAGLSNPTLGL